MASSKNQSSLKKLVYETVRQIPRGKVATYGQIVHKLKSESEKLKIDTRVVGWMLHQNKDPEVPCHRVVDRNGRLAPNFGGPSLGSYGRLAPSKPIRLSSGRSGAFDGWEEQRRRLLLEEVPFVDNNHVDLDKCLWSIV